jgi:hypothetical protein
MVAERAHRDQSPVGLTLRGLLHRRGFDLASDGVPALASFVAASDGL